MKADSEWPLCWVETSPERWENKVTGYYVLLTETDDDNGQSIPAWIPCYPGNEMFTTELNTLSLLDCMDMCDTDFASRQD